MNEAALEVTVRQLEEVGHLYTAARTVPAGGRGGRRKTDRTCNLTVGMETEGRKGFSISPAVSLGDTLGQQIGSVAAPQPWVGEPAVPGYTELVSGVPKHWLSRPPCDMRGREDSLIPKQDWVRAGTRCQWVKSTSTLQGPQVKNGFIFIQGCEAAGEGRKL